MKEMVPVERELCRAAMRAELEPMAKLSDETSPTRWSLVNRLKDWDDQASWKEFFEIYWKLIYAVALKSGLGDSEAQEVVQETVITVAKKMPGFKPDPTLGSFKAWLLVITRRRIIDQLRKRPPPGRFQDKGNRPDDTARTATVDRIADPNSLELDNRWNQEWQKNLMDAAIERIKNKVSPRQFKIFYLHVIKTFPARQVADTLNVSIAQVYLAKHRVGALVKKELRYLETRAI
jgi:RNA polymerase sigma-70 factor (ECF subfamily)